MFCTNCGSQLQPGAAFCILCGNKLGDRSRAAVPSAPEAKQRAQSFVQAPGDAPNDEPMLSTGRCPWCGAVVHGGDIRSCPQCGAALRVRQVSSKSGWVELPPRKDMAKLQFGDSFCQIEGLYVPVAEMNLAASDSVYFSHHVLLWMDPGVNINAMSMRGGWKRMFAA